MLPPFCLQLECSLSTFRMKKKKERKNMNKLLCLAVCVIIGCGSSATTTQRPTTPPAAPVNNSEFVFTEMEENYLMIAPGVQLTETDQPLKMSLVTAWESEAASRRTLPNGVGVVFEPQTQLPNQLLLINFGNGHWFKCETIYHEPTMAHVAILPLNIFEKMVETYTLAGFLGDRTTFVQFALRDGEVAYFQRFVREIYRRTGRVPPPPSQAPPVAPPPNFNAPGSPSE